MIKGTVSCTQVNSYLGSTTDTEITLTDGRTILFNGVAPIPTRHTVEAEGEAGPLAETLQSIHPEISEQGLQDRLTRTSQEAFYAVSIRDTATKVEYQVRDSLSAGLTT